MTISTRETDAFVAANRFGLGPNTLSKAESPSGSPSGSMNEIRANPRDWLLSQINSTPAFHNEDKLEHSNAIIKQVFKLRGKTEEAKNAVRRIAMKNFRAETVARLHQAVISDQPLYERLVLFWSNHFTVSATKKNIIRPIVGAYEREAIRPHVLGTFPDMLRAAVQHPAMLLYLDNASSVGPNSPMGKRRDKGLNENLAREIMELHTLGVNGGYTQDDVIGLAKIITGWTLKPRRKGGGGYSFVDRQHEPGSHRILGNKYSQRGEKQGLAALDDLALHPSTAKFVATKLARHFIADDPDEKDIRTLSKTYLASDGDLKAIYKTLIEMDAPWRTPLSKIKTPYEMVISSARLVRAELYPKTPFSERDYKRLIKSLSLLEQLPFSATSPAGWSDKAEDWISPKATLNRIEWCHAFAQILRPQNNPHEIAREIIGSVAGPQTLIWIERAPSPVEGLALFLASPEWQRR